ncbi:MAG: tandem-95 repeat protein [Deltaproteobacteria bacterium]|nr:tandem-95 repeat protein [Deltaproteobacteria bacterium]
MRDFSHPRAIRFCHHKIFHMLLLVILGIFLGILTGCGTSGSGTTTTEAGTITFSLIVAENASSVSSPAQKQAAAEAIDCAEFGIDRVDAEVVDENGELLVGNSWPCSYHQGTISGVKSGTNRTLRVLLKNEASEVRLRGQKSDITVIANQTTDIGTITLIQPEDIENNPPVLDHIGSREISEGELLHIQLAAIDPDGDALNYYASQLPRDPDGRYYDVDFDSATGAFTWQNPVMGEYRVLFMVTDNGWPKLGAWEEVILAVGDIKRSPILDPIESQEVAEGDLIRFPVTASDPDGSVEDLTFEASGLPAGADFSFDADSAVWIFTWPTPTSDAAGNYFVEFKVIDSDQNLDTQEVRLTLGQCNIPPKLLPIGNRFVEHAGDLIEFPVTATDADSNDLSFEISPVADQAFPEGAVFDQRTRMFRWQTPTSSTQLNYYVRFYVQDDGEPLESDSEIVIITVGSLNRTPVAADDSITLDEGGTVSLLDSGQASVLFNDTDPDGDGLFVSWHSDTLSGYLNLHTDGTFSYTHDGSEKTDDCFIYQVNDGYGGTDSATVTIRILPVNDPPDAVNDSATVQQGGLVSVLDSGYSSLLHNDTDPDNDILHVDPSPVKEPSHGSLVLNEDGTFTYQHDGTLTINDSFIYRVNDGNGGTDTATVTLAIFDPADTDNDHDGYTESQGDCNDDDPFIHPGATEICGDGVDQNCDGFDCPEPATWYKDADGDSYSDGNSRISANRPDGYYLASELTASTGDCDDTNPLVNPGAVEEPYNGWDDDCNPATPDDDLDADGYLLVSDCNDSNADIHPGASEIACDGIDQDCDGFDFCQVVFVDRANGQSNNSGRSWDQSLPTISEAIDAANDGDEIWVRKGSYILVDQIEIDKDLALFGGFAGNETQLYERNYLENLTTVCGQSIVRCFAISEDAGTVVIDGFSIIEGKAPAGGGINNNIRASSLRVANCNFIANHALQGSALNNYNPDSDLVVINCTFRDNWNFSSENCGGGIFTCSSTAVIKDCVFEGNGAPFGGAISCFSTGSALITNCTFAENCAFKHPGKENPCGEHDLTTIKCIDPKCFVEGAGGAIHNYQSSSQILNCSFYHNNAGYGGGIYNYKSTVDMINCIAFNDSARICGDEIFSVQSSPLVTYSDIDGGYDGFGNIDADPLFAGPDYGDFHLQHNSPCIERGTNDAPELPLTDFEGQQRIMDGDNDGIAQVDMGADEFFNSEMIDADAARQ